MDKLLDFIIIVLLITVIVLVLFPRGKEEEGVPVPDRFVINEWPLLDEEGFKVSSDFTLSLDYKCTTKEEAERLKEKIKELLAHD